MATAKAPDDPEADGSATAVARTLLEVRDLHTHFVTGRGSIYAVNGVTFTLRAGETIGVVGESGSGKSVLGRTIMDLLPSTAVVPAGTVHYDGRDVRQLRRHERRHFWGPEIAMVFQDPMTSLNPVKKIGAQIIEPLRFHLGLGRREAAERAVELLDQVRIPSPRRRLDQYPHELSGGMRQRVMIAVALSCEPRLLIADEPTTALDVTVQRQILDLLSGLQQQRRMAMILITHDLGVVAGHADHVAVMYGGQIVESATTVELFEHVQHRYTEALLRSIPRLELPSHSRLEAIGGRPPEIRTPPAGCPFAPRCRYAQPDCSSPIEDIRVTSEHVHRCRYPAPLNRVGEA